MPPVGASGEVGFAAAMKQWGIKGKHKSAVSSWIVRFKKLYDLKKTDADVRDFFDGPRARAAAPRPSGAGAAAPCASTSLQPLQPDDVKQANRLLNELQGAKLIGKDKRRTPGPFKRSLLAGQQAAIAPVW